MAEPDYEAFHAELERTKREEWWALRGQEPAR